MFILEVIYATAIFFSNPINLFPVYESLYKIKSIEERMKHWGERRKYFTKFVLRILVIFFCFLVCFFVPSFINFLSFVGSFLFPILGIYIPIMLNYSYFNKKGTLSRRKKALLIGLALVCLVLFTASTISSVLNKSDQ